MEGELLRIATLLAGRLVSGGKVLSCSALRDTLNGFPSSHKRKEKEASSSWDSCEGRREILEAGRSPPRLK